MQKPKAAPVPVIPDIEQMDIRVGKIVEVWKHPESEKLYCEKIDIGNGEIREIASGLQKFVPMDVMQDALVVVICNLKAKKLGGFPSHGMVLCAEIRVDGVASAVELLSPPEGSVVGDPITFEGQGRTPPAELPAKTEKNPWFRVQPNFKVDGNGFAKWNDSKWTTSKGDCCAKTIRNGEIH